MGSFDFWDNEEDSIYDDTPLPALKYFALYLLAKVFIIGIITAGFVCLS